MEKGRFRASRSEGVRTGCLISDKKEEIALADGWMVEGSPIGYKGIHNNLQTHLLCVWG